jgi:hydroxypyruvate isomerase
VAKSIETAKVLGCQNLVIHSQAMDDKGQFTHDGSDLSDSVKLYSVALTAQDAARLAEKAGVTLVLEASQQHFQTRLLYDDQRLYRRIVPGC